MKRILVLRGGALGDFILGLPALRAIRQAFPGAHLELVAPAAVLALANRWVDIATPIEGADIALFFRDGTLPEEVTNRYGNLDLVVLWLADGSGAVRRQFERLGAMRILWAPALPQKPGRHAADHLLESLRPLGIPVDLDSDKAGQPGARASCPPGTVTIHPGSGGSWKCWPAERFARIVKHLQSAGHRVALIQGPADSLTVERVMSICRERPPLVVTGLKVDELAAFISSCSCYLGNDSGVTHLAAVVGTPTVALFGPTDPAVWGPRGPKVTVLSHSTECSPCAQGKAIACQPRMCLESITVQQVISSLDEMMM